MGMAGDAVDELGVARNEDIATAVKLQTPMVNLRMIFSEGAVGVSETIYRLLGRPVPARWCPSPSARVLLVGRESTVVDRCSRPADRCFACDAGQEEKAAQRPRGDV
jgi:hypothetical protein